MYYTAGAACSPRCASSAAWTALIRSLLTRAAMSSAVQNETAISSESPALRSRSAVGNGSASTRG